jgi:predicted DsbA family dithiol-disulfide isomerase
MARLEVFFDYICPYCMRAHQYLKELLPRSPKIEILWRPCEAHPRPDPYGPHSELCIQGYFFALEHGADLWEYHDRMFRAALEDRDDIEDAAVLAARVEGLLDCGAFRRALERGTYRKAQLAANDYAYKKSGVWVVPAYRLNGRKLDAVEDVGVTKEQLKRFLSDAQGK